MCALEKGGTVSGIIRDFFTCTRYSSCMPETFDLVKEQSIGSPPSSFLSRVVHSASTDLWSPVVWECFGRGRTLCTDGRPLTHASQCQPLRHKSSHDTVLQGSKERACRCNVPYVTVSFFRLLLAVPEAW